MKRPAAFIIAASLLLLFAHPVAAKSYTISKAFIDMQMGPDGTMEVTETITFSFSGSFSFAYRDFEPGPWQITDIQVEEAGRQLRYETSSHNGGMRIKWHYSAANQKKTFTIRYKLRNALKCHEDVCDLYWKIWGDGWDSKVSDLEGAIRLPGTVTDTKDVYTWGHPDLERGKIMMSSDMQTVVFQAFAIPRNSWAEVRVVFPARLAPGAPNDGKTALASIIEEENNYSAPIDPEWIILPVFFAVWFLGFFGGIGLAILGKTNPSLAKKLGKFFAIGVFGGMALLFGLVFSIDSNMQAGDILIAVPFMAAITLAFTFCWAMWGREPQVDYHAEYEREIPYDYSPALVSALLHQASGQPSQDMMAAELLDLCLSERLKLRRVKKEKKGWFGKDEDYEIMILNDDE